MKTRGILLGVVVTVLLVAGAVPAQALLGVEPPPVPTPGQLQALAASFVPDAPAVVPPATPDPQDPQLPPPPFVNPPAGASPLLAAAGSASVLTCEAAYLGPLLGIVLITSLFDTAGVQPLVKPGFLSPAFSPVTNACVIAPYPSISSFGPDENITQQLASLPDAPGAGGVPTVDPFASAPAPFASLVVALLAAQDSVNQYAYGGEPGVNVAKTVTKRLACE